MAKKKHGKVSKAQGDKRPKSTDKRIDALLELAWDQEWTMRQGGSQHVMCYPPNGSAMISMPCTPSGNKTPDNKAKQLERSGLVLS